MTSKLISSSLVAGFASAFVASMAASAADLPVSKAEPVEYVKVCSAFGTGFFYIPASNTCLQISGQYRADYYYVQPSKRTDNATVFRGQARIRFDARTNTDYGVLRSFLEVQTDNNLLGTTQNGVTGTNILSVRRAYLQFGGLTAGYAWSPYSFYEQYYNSIFFAPFFGEQGRRQMISYTAQVGKAWAALSIEDPISHRSSRSFGNGSATAGTPLSYAGTSTPDVVGVVGYDDNKGLGRIQVMGAVHQNRPLDSSYGSNYGYAVGLGGNLNIPVLSGAYVAVETSYANGAMKYLNSGGVDAYGSPATPHDFTRAKGWALESEAGLNITPALQLVLFGGYLNYQAPSIATKATDNFKFYVVGGQVNYTVVKGFIAGGEVWYQNKDPKGPDTASVQKVDAVGAGIRLRRTF